MVGGMCSFGGDNLEEIKNEQYYFYRESKKEKGKGIARGVFTKNSTLEIYFERLADSYKLVVLFFIKECVGCFYGLYPQFWLCIRLIGTFILIQVLDRKYINAVQIVNKSVWDVYENNKDDNSTAGKTTIPSPSHIALISSIPL